MKKIIVVFLLICGCMFLYACSGNNTENIETNKSGKIDVNIYSKEEVNNDKISLTPLLEIEKNDITDDGKGLYRVNLEQDGNGTVSLSDNKFQAGSIVTVNVVPDKDWEVIRYVLDYDFLDSSTFTMPDHDVTFRVIFRNKRHNVILDGSGSSWINFETESPALEGDTFVFTMQPDKLVWYYYEDEDVYVRSSQTNDSGEYEYYEVTKIGDNKFSFTMPEEDCVVGCSTHEFGRIEDGYVMYSPDGNEYNSLGRINKDENNVADYIKITLTQNNVNVNIGDNIRCKETIVSIDYLNESYEISYIFFYDSTNHRQIDMKEIDSTHYSFEAGYGYISICLKDYDGPEGSKKVECLEASNGNIQTSGAYFMPGDNVIVTATPSEGYALTSLKYKLVNSEKEVEILQNNDVYSFVMPDSDVSVFATFKSINEVNCVIEVYNAYIQELTLSQTIAKIQRIVLIGDTYTPQSYIDEVNDDLELYFEKGETIQLRFKSNYYTGFKQVYLSYGNENNNILRALYGGECDVEFVVPDGDFSIIIIMN